MAPRRNQNEVDTDKYCRRHQTTKVWPIVASVSSSLLVASIISIFTMALDIQTRLSSIETTLAHIVATNNETRHKQEALEKLVSNHTTLLATIEQRLDMAP